MNRNPIVKLAIVRRALAAAVVLALLFGGRAFASPDPAAGASAPAHDHAGRRQGQRYTSDMMMSQMKKRLNLTDAQAKQIKQVLDSHQAEEIAKTQALKSAREALRQAAAATPFNEGAIRNAAVALGQAEGDWAVLHARIHSQIVPVLDAEQQEKFAKLSEVQSVRWRSNSSEPSN